MFSSDARARATFASLAVFAAVCVAAIAYVGAAPSLTCQVASPAFCDTFDQGPSSPPGRGGDLNRAKWSAGRVAPQDFVPQGANPALPATVPACRVSLPSTTVYPPNDTLVCDATASRSAQLMTAVAMQNYGINSNMVRQPFDFAGRTGKIVFDVDAVMVNSLANFVSVDITEDPIPAPTFREFDNYEYGPVPRNGIMIKFADNCQTQGTLLTAGKVMVYTNYAGQIITPTFVATQFTNPACVRTQLGSLNHFEIRLSQQLLEVWASDHSTDEGVTYPNFRRIYSANINLAFSRGYVHFAARNHASKKYGYGPNGVYHWDNVGFDGPVIVTSRGYEVPDNTTTRVIDSTTVQNLGYHVLAGGTTLQIPGVDITGATGASLTMTSFFNTVTHTATTSWGLRYRLNGGTWRDRLLTATEVGAINGTINNQAKDGTLALVIDFPQGDLRNGTNTLELLPINLPTDYPPAVANIDLHVKLAGGSVGPVPTAPANLRVVQSMLLWQRDNLLTFLTPPPPAR